MTVFCLSACTTLPLSPEGKRKADLMGDFLEVSFAQREGKESQFQALQQLLAREPDSIYLKQLLVAQAVADGAPGKAAPYVDFIQAPDSTAEDWRVYGTYQATQQDYAGALASFEKALAQDPDNEELIITYINLLARVNPQKAVEKIEQLARENPSYASEFYTEIARLHLFNQRFGQALSYLDKALVQDPQNARALLWRGQLYEQNQQYFLMLHDYEQLDKMNMANTEVYNKMAAVFLLAQDLDKAEAYFLKAYELDPTDPGACYFLSALAEQRQDYEKAIAFAKSASDYPSTSGKWLQVSFYQKKLGRTKDMLRTLEEAHKYFKGSVEVGFFYGLALNDEGKYNQAAQVLGEVVQLSPDYDEARLHYAYALESMKKYEEMENHVQVLLQRNPANAAALNLLAYSLAQRGVRLDEAQNYISRALAVNPDDISFLDTQAWIYLKQGNLDQADAVLSSLTQEELHRNAEIAYHMGYLRNLQGRKEEALEYLKIAKDEWPEAKKLYRQLIGK